MNYELRIKLLIIAVLAATTGAFAQKYPERRIARQGTKLYEKGDFTGAEAEYRSALKLNPELREAVFNLGGALWRQEEKAQEAADVWTGIAADSLADGGMVSAANYNLGNVSLVGRQIDAAIEAYKQSLRLRPDDMQAKFNLAYAQKLKQQQENQDQNQDQNQDNQGGGQDNQDQDQNQNEDRNDDDQNDSGNGQNEENDKDGDGKNDPQDGDGEGQDGNEPPPPSGQGEAKIDPRAAEQILDAMQAAEDDTREKVNAKEVQVGARSGKNW